MRGVGLSRRAVAVGFSAGGGGGPAGGAFLPFLLQRGGRAVGFFAGADRGVEGEGREGDEWQRGVGGGAADDELGGC